MWVPCFADPDDVRHGRNSRSVFHLKQNKQKKTMQLLTSTEFSRSIQSYCHSALRQHMIQSYCLMNYFTSVDGSLWMQFRVTRPIDTRVCVCAPPPYRASSFLCVCSSAAGGTGAGIAATAALFTLIQTRSHQVFESLAFHRFDKHLSSMFYFAQLNFVYIRWYRWVRRKSVTVLAAIIHRIVGRTGARAHTNTCEHKHEQQKNTK